MKLTSANIEFNQQGTPVARDFDDVYFSNDNGLEESRYVFLQHNGLPSRWHDWQQPAFTIGETGFGTGLNFLLAWHEFNLFRQQHPSHALKRLHFISTEKYPLTATDLARALDAWPTLSALAHELIEAYPPAVSGCHRLVLGQGSVVLDLWFDDIHHSLPGMRDVPGNGVDAWFLDGFAPSKNPQMWSDLLFSNMARLSAPEASFATFTAAGIVKRGLREAGFEVNKRPGFGRKRDMLAGTLSTPPEHTGARIFHRSRAASTVGSIAIIGAGLAGASLALSLCQAGQDVSLYCKDAQPAQGASGNPQGGFYPQLNAIASISSQIQAAGFLHARQRYTRLLKDGYDFAHQWCGVLMPAFSDPVSERQQKLLENQAWPESLVEGVDARQASAIAGVELPYPGLFIPLGGWLSPPQLVNAMLRCAADSGHYQQHCGKSLQHLTKSDRGWQLTWQDGSQCEAQTVILAGGADTPALPFGAELSLRLVRGQVEQIPSEGELAGLQTVLCHKGYLTPEYQGFHALGSTYGKDDVSTEYRNKDALQNIRTHQRALANSPWAQMLPASKGGRAAIRCTTPDHLPSVGAMPDFETQLADFADLYKAKEESCYPIAADCPGLFVLTGLGSRGLTTAPLMAEVLTCQLLGRPQPLAGNLLDALMPNRFAIRALRRRQA